VGRGWEMVRREIMRREMERERGRGDVGDE
jgi:hypothetical protein